ncbi:MAG TPA: hypothetical protein VGK64_24300 [Bryobacteraceae bacterium]
MTLLLLSVVFLPTIQWAISAALRNKPFQTDGAEVFIPRLWAAAKDGSVIQAWTLCPTIFCSSPRSSIKIQVEKNLIGQEDAWISRAKLVLSRRQSISPLTRTLVSPIGKLDCLQTVSGGIAEAACFGPDSGLVASFEGAILELEDFYSIVKSSRAREK